MRRLIARRLTELNHTIESLLAAQTGFEMLLDVVEFGGTDVCRRRTVGVGCGQDKSSWIDHCASGSSNTR